jgi:hypothetical protein
MVLESSATQLSEGNWGIAGGAIDDLACMTSAGSDQDCVAGGGQVVRQGDVERRVAGIIEWSAVKSVRDPVRRCVGCCVQDRGRGYLRSTRGYCSGTCMMAVQRRCLGEARLSYRGQTRGLWQKKGSKARSDGRRWWYSRRWQSATKRRYSASAMSWAAGSGMRRVYAIVQTGAIVYPSGTGMHTSGQFIFTTTLSTRYWSRTRT